MSLLAQHGQMLRPPGGGQSYLDLLPVIPRAAYSLRKLISTATVAVRVRRSSDNAEQDIGFSGDALNLVALASFVGSDSAYVVSWRDQTGNGYDRAQATASRQPRIVNAGVYEGKLVYDGVDDAMSTPALPFGTAFAALYLKAMLPTASTAWVFYETSISYTTRPGAFLVFSEGGEVRVSLRNTNSFWTRHYIHSQTSLRQTTLLMQVAVVDSTIPMHRLYVDGSLVTPESAVGSSVWPVNFRSDAMYSGARAGSSLHAPMWEETIALYDVDTSSIRTDIEGVVG